MSKFEKKFTLEQEKEIIQTYLTNKISLQKVGQKYGISGAGVGVIMKRHNVARRSYSESGTEHTIDESFFEKIDNHTKANLLGFFWADACLTGKENSRRLSIELSAVDTDHLEWIKQTLQSSVPVTLNKKKGHVYWATFNKKIVSDLQKLGLYPRKSLTIGFPTTQQVPENFLPGFVAGVFEGDGTIVARRHRTGPHTPSYFISICGTEAFCDWMIDLAKTKIGINAIKIKRILKSGNLFYDFRVFGNISVMKFCEWMYNGCEHKMQRKYQRFLQLRQMYDENYQRVYTSEQKMIIEKNIKERSKNHSIFLKNRSREEISRCIQAVRESKRKTFVSFYVKDPKGQIYHSNCMNPFSIEFGLKNSSLFYLIKEKPTQMKGWTLPTQTEIEEATKNGTLIIKEY